MMRRFRLVRVEDVSGVSGTGIVAEGVMFSSGRAVLDWRGPRETVTIYDSVSDLEAIHGHQGRTLIEWLDTVAQSDSSVGKENPALVGGSAR